MSDTVGSYLRSDEKLLWKGRPQQGLRLYGQDVFMIPFSLIWGGGVLAAFTVRGTAFAAMPFPFVLFPLIFGVAGIYITVGRLIHDAWIRSNTEYALTDRGVLILKSGLGSDLTALDVGRIDQVRFKPRGDRGDIVFGRQASLFGLFGARSFKASFALWVPAMSETPQFLGVEMARRLYDQIEGVRAQSR